MFRLTDKEMDVLAAFIDKYQELNKHKIDVFSAAVKKQIAENLDMPDFNVLNNYIKALKEKNAIRKVRGTYQISPILIRGSEEGVYFEYK